MTWPPLLASRYGCPALEATPVSTTGCRRPVDHDRDPRRRRVQPPAAGAPSTGDRDADRRRRPSPAHWCRRRRNLTGICDRSIQPNIDAALDGTENIDEVITAVEPRLWNMSTVLPILQDTTIVAAGPSVQNVSLTGAVPVGIVGDAGNWVEDRRV